MAGPLGKYFDLIKKYPQLFKNNGAFGEIKIITDKKRILAEQRRIRTELKKAGHPAEWIEIGVLSEDQWYYTVRDMVEFPGGYVAGYIRSIARKSQEGGFASILVCRQGENYLLIRKFHHEDRAWSWEFPAGFGEPGLSARENAKKELTEETGIKKAKLTQLAKVRSGKGGICVFLAEVPADQAVTPEVGEGIVDFKWVSKTRMEQMIKRGTINAPHTLWAYTLIKL
jgi:ADP-ribose pyrophosphatase